MQIDLTEEEVAILQTMLSQPIQLQAKAGDTANVRKTLDIIDSLATKLKGEGK